MIFSFFLLSSLSSLSLSSSSSPLSSPLSSSSSLNILKDILQEGVDNYIYTGAIAIIGLPNNLLTYTIPVGSYSYTNYNYNVTKDSIFDIASLTKVLSTTSIIALLYQKGYITLDTYIKDILGDNFNNNGKENITIKHCLLHNAGFSPDPIPWYWDEEFNCPNTDDEYPAEDFSCVYSKIYKSLMNESLNSNPGEVYVYSDLSFLTLQMVAGQVVLNNNLVTRKDYRQECIDWIETHDSNELEPIDIICAYEAYVRQEVFNFQYPSLDKQSTTSTMKSTTYLPPSSIWSNIMPTLNDTGPDSYTHKRLQGQVSDGDCYAMGGLCGHAGVFSTAPDISLFLNAYLQQSLIDTNSQYSSSSDNIFFLNSTTVKLFTTIVNVTQSSRALGWTINTPLISDYGYDQSCGAMSNLTYMHTGYTGTCFCVDPSPTSPMWSVILTNRVYNCDGQLCPSGSSSEVKAIYKEFNTQAHNIFYPSN